MSDEQAKFDAVFNEIAGGEAIVQMTGALHRVYAGAIASGFPEERAWSLTQDVVNKLWSAVEPLVTEQVKKIL